MLRPSGVSKRQSESESRAAAFAKATAGEPSPESRAPTGSSIWHTIAIASRLNSEYPYGFVLRSSSGKLPSGAICPGTSTVLKRSRQNAVRSCSPGVARELGDLRHPACSVVVLRVAFGLAVLVGRHPREVLLEPLARSLTHLRSERTGVLEHRDRARDLDEVQRIDDADTTPGHAPLDGLCVAAGAGSSWCRSSTNHARRCRAACVRVSPFTRDHPRRGQRRHVQAEPDQRVAVRDEVIRVRHAVALDVGAVRVQPDPATSSRPRRSSRACRPRCAGSTRP